MSDVHIRVRANSIRGWYAYAYRDGRCLARTYEFSLRAAVRKARRTVRRMDRLGVTLTEEL